MALLRKCKKCGLEANCLEDLEKFKTSNHSLYKKVNFCKKCDSNLKREEKAKNPEAWLRLKRSDHFKHKYGLTLEQRASYINTVGKCEICEAYLNDKTAHIDHSHKKSHIRGVLCNKCNTGLGKFGDNVQLLNKAMKYLIEREHHLDSENFGIEKHIDNLWHMLDQGLPFDKTSQFYNAIAAVKNQFPKPN